MQGPGSHVTISFLLVARGMDGRVAGEIAFVEFPANESERNESGGKLFKAKLYREAKTFGPPVDISIPRAIFDIVTCRFLMYGDDAKNIRDQLMQEQLNVALVSALFLTISIPAMLWITELDQYGWTERDKSVFGLSLCMATSNFAIAVIFAVFFSLSIQECVDDAELRRYCKRMGRYLQLSSMSFVVGIITLGGFSWTTWCYVTFSLNWFLGLVIAFIAFNTFGIAFTGLIIMIKHLYAAKQGRHGTAIVSREEIKKALQAYLASLEDPELADVDKFKDFILERTKCSELSHPTWLRLKAELNQSLKQISGGEYEDDKPE